MMSSLLKYERQQKRQPLPLIRDLTTDLATDISIIKEIKGDAKNQPYEDTKKIS